MRGLIAAIALALAACSLGPAAPPTTRSLDPAADYRIVYSKPTGMFDSCRSRSADTADISNDGKLIYRIACDWESGPYHRGPGNLVMVDLKGDRREKVILPSFLVEQPKANLPTADKAKFLPDGRILIVCEVTAGRPAEACGAGQTRRGVRTLISVLDPATGAITPVEWLDYISIRTINVSAADNLVLLSGVEVEAMPQTFHLKRGRVIAYDVAGGAIRRQPEVELAGLVLYGPPFGSLARIDGSTAIAVSDPAAGVILRDLGGGKLATLTIYNNEYAAFYPQGPLYAAWGMGGRGETRAFQIRNALTGGRVCEAPLTTELPPNELKFISPGKFAVFYGLQDKLEIWEAGSPCRKLQTLGQKAGSQGIPPELIASPDGRYVGWSTSGDGVMVAERRR